MATRKLLQGYSINFLFQSHKALNNAEIIVAIKQVRYSS